MSSPAGQILDRVCQELGLSPALLGGRAGLVRQIEAFLEAEQIPAEFDPQTQPDAWRRLVARIVVPETSFFRYPESFAALAEWATPRRDRRLRVLCLPCSTGQEPVSVAVTLREAGVHSFRIEAADVSPEAVELARRGIYPPAAGGIAGHERWFIHEEHQLRPRPEILETIQFSVENIFTYEPEPPGFDVVFCRNLAIYFDGPRRGEIFTLLDRWLAPGGLLFLGPGEAASAIFHGWRGAGRPMSFAFLRTELPAPLRLRSRPPLRRPNPLSVAPATLPPATAPRPQPTASAPSPPTLAQIREIADAGDFTTAAAKLEQLHAATGPTAPSLLLAAVIAEASGDAGAAEVAYRKVLYLEPEHVDALLHLALLLEQSGRGHAAAPLRRRAAKLTTSA